MSELHRGRRMWPAAIGVLAIVMIAPPAAQATITIGSNLGRAPNNAHTCSPACTLAPTFLLPDAAEPAGLTSPVNGTVVTWRIRVGSTNSAVAFRVLRRFPDGFATGRATSATVTPPINATTEFDANLPISIGETIGIDCCLTTSRYEVFGTTGTDDLWLPVLANGEPPRDTFNNNPPTARELAINADIEPTSAFTIDRIKHGKGGKLTVTATMPNAGVLTGGDARDKGFAAGGHKVKYLKRRSLLVGAAATVNLQVKPTRVARQLLASKGRLKASLKLAFTPTGGSASTQIVRVKLNP